MANLDLDSVSGRYRIRFWYGGRQFKRSLKTNSQREAETTLSRVEELIGLLERGRVEIPPGADPGEFILSDGRLTAKPDLPKTWSLEKLFAAYVESLPAGAKDESTLYTEKIHRTHLLRVLGKKTLALSLSPVELQSYAEKRAAETFRGKHISGLTIKKEIATFRVIWNWAHESGHLPTGCPVRGMQYGKPPEKPPFMTWTEIEQILKRGKVSPKREAELWDSLFLTARETDEALAFVKALGTHRFVYPMFVFAAHTGARRSEILRSQIEDFDFQTQTVLIREKKRIKNKSLSYRRVEMSPLLWQVMADWFSVHPGGTFTICRMDKSELGGSDASHYFTETLSDSKWDKIRGFHVFRHSFASNLAGAGVDQRVIDEFMGHQTEEMRKRYRHLFPEQRRQAIGRVFGLSG